MKFFDELRQGASNVIADIKRNMAAKAADNKVIKDIESSSFRREKETGRKDSKVQSADKG